MNRCLGSTMIRGLLALLCIARSSTAQERFPTAESFLNNGVRLEASQLAALSRGEVVNKVLPTGDQRDVAVFAAVQVNVPRAFFIERQSVYPRALLSPTRTSAHLFGAPATLADVAAVDLSGDDVKEVSKCQPNACNFKLPAADMSALRQAVDLSGSDARARVTTFARQRMVQYVNDYRQRGNAAMIVYDDFGSVRSSDALAAMLRDSSLLFRVSPELGRYLTTGAPDTLAGATNVIFWSVDELPHVRQILRITDQTLYQSPEIAGTSMIAAKQIYADHYFEAGLELLAAVDRPMTSSADGAPAGITLIAVRRYRFDALPSGGLLNIRGRVIGGLRDNVRSDLARLKQESEAAWRQAPHGAR